MLLYLLGECCAMLLLVSLSAQLESAGGAEQHLFDAVLTNAHVSLELLLGALARPVSSASETTCTHEERMCLREQPRVAARFVQLACRLLGLLVFERAACPRLSTVRERLVRLAERCLSGAGGCETGATSVLLLLVELERRHPSGLLHPTRAALDRLVRAPQTAGRVSS